MKPLELLQILNGNIFFFLISEYNDSHWCSYYYIPGSFILWSMETEDKRLVYITEYLLTA